MRAHGAKKRWGVQASAKHFCKVCKTFVQPDEKSILHHELNNRHKNNLRRLQQDKERNKEREARERARLEQELARIDRAARGLAPGDAKRGAARGPAPGPGKTQAPASQGAGAGAENADDDGNEAFDIYQVDPDAILGQYSVDGTLYLEGPLHEDLLQVGCDCEAVRLVRVPHEEDLEEDGAAEEDEDEEDWRAARVVRIGAHWIEGTSACEREYTIKFAADGVERTVACTELRIIAPKPPHAQLHGFDAASDPDAAQGGWSTVAVHYTELKDAAPQTEPEPKQEAEEAARPASLTAAVRAAASSRGEVVAATTSRGPTGRGADAAHEDDAYATFNPFGGDYKGVNLSESASDSAAAADPRDAEARAKVKFKRRKKRAK